MWLLYLYTVTCSPNPPALSEKSRESENVPAGTATVAARVASLGPSRRQQDYLRSPGGRWGGEREGAKGALPG